jgi:hypothetical protein
MRSCPQLELLEVWAYLEAGDQEADPAQEFRLCWRQFRHRDKIARQDLTGPRPKKDRRRRGPARSGTCAGRRQYRCRQAQASSRQTILSWQAPRVIPGQPRAHKVRGGASGGHIRLFRLRTRMGYWGRQPEDRAMQETGEVRCSGTILFKS